MSRAEARDKRIVLVTCPTLALARKIARAVVRKHLAACVNVVRNPVESFYTWKGKLESAHEHLLIIKTTAKRLPQLEKEVLRLHSYDVPEFIVIPLIAGSAKYLAWLSDSVKKTSKQLALTPVEMSNPDFSNGLQRLRRGGRMSFRLSTEQF
jgi:periplasmic divalent cation tolerance protein